MAYFSFSLSYSCMLLLVHIFVLIFVTWFTSCWVSSLVIIVHNCFYFTGKPKLFFILAKVKRKYACCMIHFLSELLYKSLSFLYYVFDRLCLMWNSVCQMCTLHEQIIWQCLAELLYQYMNSSTGMKLANFIYFVSCDIVDKCHILNALHKLWGGLLTLGQSVV